MQFFRTHPKTQWRAFGVKCVETAIKAAMLMSYPVLPTICVCLFWYYALYTNHIHFHEKLLEIATAAWIPTFGILYALFAAVVLNTVWNEYKNIRMSIKCYDIATFMNLRDEDVSPVVHVMLGIFSWAVLGAFMGLHYPDALSGLACVGSTAYIFGLIFFVIMEIDNPLSGIWFIRNIHQEWLDTDVKVWREGHYRKIKQTTILEITEGDSPPREAPKAA